MNNTLNDHLAAETIDAIIQEAYEAYVVSFPIPKPNILISLILDMSSTQSAEVL